MAAMSAMDRCLALPEMVDKIISFLDMNGQINCACVNSAWNKLALARVFSRVICTPNNLRLLHQSLTRKALAQNSGYIQDLLINHPILLPILANAPNCTNLKGLQCDFANFTKKQFDMLRKLIRKNPGLTRVRFYDVDSSIDLQELVHALQTCQGLTLFNFSCKDGYNFIQSTSFHITTVRSRGLASLIRGLAYPHFRLKCLGFEVRVGDTPEETLFEEGRENHNALFPSLETLHVIDTGRHNQLTAEAFFVPILREAPELKDLTVPNMSGVVAAAAAAAVVKCTPPLEHLTFYMELQPGCAEMVKASRRTLRRLDASSNQPALCEPLLGALLPMNDGTDACLRTNLQEIELVLEESPTVSATIQGILTTLPNLKAFRNGFRRWRNVSTMSGGPARLQICDMVTTAWACVGLQDLALCLGSRTAEEYVTESRQERLAKIYRVYKQLGELTQLKSLILACDMLGGPSSVELDFSFKSGVRAMEPCLKHLALLDIEEVCGIRFSNKERAWVLQQGPHLARENALQV
ncbi:hypothetical protein BGZ81_004413 [Podila clonocystis]|nr:hypothetical protein BGZ81_004413 [Podila clonocystis]